MGKNKKSATPIVKAVGVQPPEIKSGSVTVEKETYDVVFLKEWFNRYGLVKKDQRLTITAKEFEELSKLNFVKEV